MQGADNPDKMSSHVGVKVSRTADPRHLVDLTFFHNMPKRLQDPPHDKR